MKQYFISSKDNPRIHYIRKLINDKRFRYEQKEYIAEGPNILDYSISVKELYLCEGVDKPNINAGKIYYVDKNVFRTVTTTENSQGVIALLNFDIYDVSELSHNISCLLLDRIQDPGNMGTIIRTACAFGINNILITKGCTDPFSPKVVRSAVGAIQKISFFNLNSYSSIKDRVLVAADIEGEDLRLFNWPKHYVLCLGNESQGLSKDILSISKYKIRIPITKKMESLNVSVAAGILLYSATFFSK